MTNATTLWMLTFAVAAALFFGVACAITVVGIRDLKDLLSRSVKNR